MPSSRRLQPPPPVDTSFGGWPLSRGDPPSPPSSTSSPSSSSPYLGDPHVDGQRVSARNSAQVTSGSRTAKNRKSAAVKAGVPPRPANAWICYRSARVHELKANAEYAGLPQADISKILGHLWRDERPEVRRHYVLKAERKKAEHRERYPDYTFRPVRRKPAKRPRKEKAISPPKAPVCQPGAPPSVLQSVSTVPNATTTFFDQRLLHTPSLPSADPVPSIPPLSAQEDVFPSPGSSSESPTPAFTLPDLHITWEPFHAAPLPHYLPSPPWSAADFGPGPAAAALELAPISAFPSSLQLDLLSRTPSFSPSLSFAPGPLDLGDPYLSPPRSSTLASFDQLWEQAVSSTDFVESSFLC